MLSRMLIIVLAFCLAASPLFADNDAALDRFRKDMASLDALTRKKKEEMKGNPLAGLLAFRSTVSSIKTVQIDGLPDDLKTAFTEAVATLTKAGAIFDGWPDKPDEVMGYVRQRMAQDPKFMENFQGQMAATGKEMEAMTKKMDEMGKKYGFSNIGGGAEAPNK